MNLNHDDCRSINIMHSNRFYSFYCLVTPGVNTSIYSSELTSSNGIYSRAGGFSANYYYETIQVTVPMGGLYTFQCNSNMDSLASFYYSPFNPSNPAANIIESADDIDDDNWEFKFQLNFPSAYTIILVVTTYSPNITGPLSIVATGPAKVTFTRISSIVNPVATSTTTQIPTTTTTTTTSTTKIPTITTTNTKNSSRITVTTGELT